MYFPCQPNCCFKGCVDKLNLVITKATLHQLKQYIATNCQAALLGYDSWGRLPLHIAASCGKADVLDWILSNAQLNKKKSKISYVDLPDEESGWTALHRSVYHGRISCVVALLKGGANMWIIDKNGFNVLDLITKDISPWLCDVMFKRNSDITVDKWSKLNRNDPSEVYTWGTNENMTLAQGSAKSRKLPDAVQYFSRKKISIKQVAMCQFHTVFLTHSGSVYSCGTSRGGRLGTAKEGVFVEPLLIRLESAIAMVSASMNHTVMVSEDGMVFCCGLNHFRTLGINPPPLKMEKPVRVTSLRDRHIIGCSAGLYHTVVWTRNALFTFGTNAGQLGHAKGDQFVIHPRQVSSLYREKDEVTLVQSCDSSIVVATIKGSVYLLHNYICRKILSRHLDISSIAVGGGKLDHSVLTQVEFFNSSFSSHEKKDWSGSSEHKELKILILKVSGDLLSWSNSHSTIDRCLFNSKQLRSCRDVAISNNGAVILFVAGKGTAFYGRYLSWQPGKKTISTSHKKEYFNRMELSDSDSVQHFTVEQIPCVFRAHTAAIGPKGRNSALLQSNPCNFITEVPEVDARGIKGDFEELYNNTNEYDAIHDVTIRVKCRGYPDKVFPAHLFVLASRFKLFSDMISSRFNFDAKNNGDNEDDSYPHQFPDLVVENINSKVFSNFLKFLYCFEEANEGNEFSVSDRASLEAAAFYWADFHNNVFKISSANKKTSLPISETSQTNLQIIVKQLYIRLGVKSDTLFLSSYPQLLDCEVECDDLVIFSAHKCVLVARIPYFQAMLFSPWVESSNKSMPKLKVSLPSDIFRFVLDFAYTDSITSLSGATSLERRCEILAAADLLIMDRLKQVAEAQIVELITLKNVAMVIEVALTFNSKQLYASCLQFVCYHLPAFLHATSLFSLEMETLEDLENLYRSCIPFVYKRATPPSHHGPSVDNFPEFEENSLNQEEVFNRKSGENFDQFSSKQKNKNKPSLLRRKLSSKKRAGMLISDLLSNQEMDEEDELIEKITSHQCSASDLSQVSENISLNHNKTQSNGKCKTSEINSSERPKHPKPASSPAKSWNITSPSQRSNVAENAPPLPSAANSKYNMLFPELGEDIEDKSRQDTNIRSSVKSGSSGSVTNRSRKKKLSNKQKRLLKEREEQTKIPSPPLDVGKSPPNAWGIPFKKPEERSSSFWDDLSNSETTVATSPIKSPTFGSNQSPWQRPPTAPISPPIAAPLHRSDSISQSVKLHSSSSLADIIHGEQINQERAEKFKQKSMESVQLEDKAMEELKCFYESSKKLDGCFFTVTRVPDDVAREIFSQRRAIVNK